MAERPRKVREKRPYQRLGEMIAEGRRRVRWPQREAARYADIDEGYWPNIERGLARPEPDKLRRIARALDLSYSTLAALAGYITQPTADDPLYVESEIREDVEIISQYPPEVVRYLRETAPLVERLGHWQRLGVPRGLPAEHDIAQHPDDEAGERNHDEPLSGSAVSGT